MRPSSWILGGACTAALFLVASPSWSQGVVWHVPADAPTIQAGITAASAGDTVVVACGTYHEHDIFLKTGVTVRSATGKPDCVIVDGDALGRVFLAQGIGDASLPGFTVTNGRARWGGGMLINNNLTSILVSDCVFHGNTVHDPSFSQGGGLDIENDYSGGWPEPVLRNVTVVNNTGAWGGGISVFYASPMLEHCLIALNNGTSISTYSGVPQLSCSDLYGNTGGDWVGDIAGQLGVNGNISADPRFCPDLVPPVWLGAVSPCMPSHNTCGLLIGALGQGCAIVSVPPAPGDTPRRLALAQNAPNPFSNFTTFGFALPATTRVRVEIFGIDGRRVACLLDTALPAGEHSVEWRGDGQDGRVVAPGVYLCRLEAAGRSLTRRVLLMR